jgi:ABC-type glutathione transport system ATPase component
MQLDSRNCTRRWARVGLFAQMDKEYWYSQNMPFVDVSHISKSYVQRDGLHSEHSLVVDDVSFVIHRGETLGLIGESGSGKSTIARMILGLIEPSSGSVTFDGQRMSGVPQHKLRSMRRRIQPVFQDPFAALNPRMRVEEIIAEPFVIHKAIVKRDLRAKSIELLRAVGLDESALERYPHEFSGGQRQRINIARALALRPELLVLDEPVSALDVSVGAQIVNLLRNLQREFQLTYLFISHSMPLVRYLSANIAVLRRGKLVEYGTRDAICNTPQDVYTQSLIAATPELRQA